MKLPSGNKAKGLLFVIVALICGLLSVVIIFSLGSKMSPSVAALEAIQDIKAGTPLDRSMFREVRLAEASLPTQLIDVNIDFTGLVAAKDISTGDIFREPAILSLSEGSPALFSARLRALGDPSLRAVEVPTDSVEGLITGMGNQDRVDIIAVYEELQVVDEFTAIAEDTLKVETIIKGAPVIGVRPGDSENIEGSPATLLIVALKAKDVEKVSLYRELGSIYASLRPFGLEEDETEEEVKEEKIIIIEHEEESEEIEEPAGETLDEELEEAVEGTEVEGNEE